MLAVFRGLGAQDEVGETGQRHIDAQYAHRLQRFSIGKRLSLEVVDGQREGDEGFVGPLVLDRLQPAGGIGLHGLGVPFLNGVRLSEERLGGLQRVVVVHEPVAALHLSPDVGHEGLARGIIIRFKGDGAAHDIAVAQHEFTAVVLHAVGLVHVAHQVVVEVAGRLLDAQQDIVDVERRSLQRVFGVVHRLLSQGFAREMEHHDECSCQQDGNRTDHHQA